MDLQITISSDRAKLDIHAVKALLHQSYWANQRSLETIQTSIENSICYGVFKDDELVGFGRVVTDYATVYWICDIIIDIRYRHNNLGKILMKRIMDTKDLKGLMGILATQDAHGLYEKYGFVRNTEKFMLRKDSSLNLLNTKK